MKIKEERIGIEDKHMDLKRNIIKKKRIYDNFSIENHSPINNKIIEERSCYPKESIDPENRFQEEKIDKTEKVKRTQIMRKLNQLRVIGETDVKILNFSNNQNIIDELNTTENNIRPLESSLDVSINKSKSPYMSKHYIRKKIFKEDIILNNKTILRHNNTKPSKVSKKKNKSKKIKSKQKIKTEKFDLENENKIKSENQDDVEENNKKYMALTDIMNYFGEEKKGVLFYLD